MPKRRLALPLTAALFVLAGCDLATIPSPSAEPPAAPQSAAPQSATLQTDRPTVSEIVRTDPRTSRASDLLDASALPLLTLIEKENGRRPHTLFVPVNEAFDAVPKAVTQRLAGEGDDAAAFTEMVVAMHWVEGADLRLDAMPTGSAIPTGRTHLTYRLVEGIGHVDYAAVLESIPAANGHVYLIDTVLVPPCQVDIGQDSPPTHAPCETWLQPPTG
jgi:uncharacterized surface protein with fasciclin (FAS1) repeats